MPAFSATLGQAILRGSIAPLETVHLMLRDEQDMLKAEAPATGNRNGSFALTFQSEAGEPIPIEAGYFLEVETAGSSNLESRRLQIPPLTLALDPTGPAASGTTVPGATVNLMFITQSGGYIQRALTKEYAGPVPRATFAAGRLTLLDEIELAPAMKRTVNKPR